MSALLGAYWVVRLDRHRPDVSVPDGYGIQESFWWTDGKMLAEALERPEAAIQERFDRGDRAWVAWRLAPDGIDEVAAWCWVATGEHDDLPVGRLLRFAPDECYGYDADARPGHRGNGFFGLLLQHAGAQMLREGRALMWGGIRDDNLASRRSCRRAGFQPVMHVGVEGRVLEVAPVDYAEPDLVARAWRMLGRDDSTSPLAPAAAHTRRS